MTTIAPDRDRTHGATSAHRRLRPRTLRKGWSDTLVLTRRNLTHTLRDPFESMIALSMPVLMVLLFGYVFGEVMAHPGPRTTVRSSCRPWSWSWSVVSRAPPRASPAT